MTIGSGRSIEPGRQLGFMWGAVALLLVLLSPFADSLASRTPPCPFKAITGVPCATCGATTSAVALAHADLAGALRASPLAAVAWITFVLGGFVAAITAWRGRGVIEPPRRIHWALRAALVAAVLGNWGYLLAAT